MRIQRVQNWKTALTSDKPTSTPATIARRRSTTRVHQVVNAGFDGQWNQRSHGLPQDQADESHDEARLVACKVRPNWAETFEHPKPYGTNS